MFSKFLMQKNVHIMLAYRGKSTILKQRITCMVFKNSVVRLSTYTAQDYNINSVCTTEKDNVFFFFFFFVFFFF